MAKRTKKKRFSLITPNHKDAVASAELKLLHTRALLAVRNFTHYEGGDQARALMERLFRDYKKHPLELNKRLGEAIERIKEQDLDKKLKEKIKQAVIEINQVAKKTGVYELWKELKRQKKHKKKTN